MQTVLLGDMVSQVAFDLNSLDGFSCHEVHRSHSNFFDVSYGETRAVSEAQGVVSLWSRCMLEVWKRKVLFLYFVIIHCLTQDFRRYYIGGYLFICSLKFSRLYS